MEAKTQDLKELKKSQKKEQNVLEEKQKVRRVFAPEP